MKPPPYASLSKGTFLIANPDLDTTLFARSVVLLCEHSSAGSFGLIINKPLEATIPEEIIPPGQLANQHIYLSFGGPIQPHHMMVVHSAQDTQDLSIPLCDGVFLGGNLNFLQEAATKSNGPYLHLSFGYCSWGPGLLEKEFLNNLWFLYPARAELVFEAPKETLWRTLLRALGGRFASLSTIPDDLTLN